MVACCPLQSADETAEVWNCTTRTARKAWACEECHEVIPVGAKHEHVRMLFDGEWSEFRTCLTCVEIGDHFACGPRVVGQLWEDLEENFYPDMKCGGPCMEGLSPASKSRLVEDRLAWLLERGQDDENDRFDWQNWPARRDRQRRRAPAEPIGDQLARENAERERQLLEYQLEATSYWRSARDFDDYVIKQQNGGPPS